MSAAADCRRCAGLLARIADESSAVPELTPAVLDQLCAMPLPGNVRELENLLHRAVAISDGDELWVDFAWTQAPAAPRAAATSRCPASLVAAAPRGQPCTIPGPPRAWLDQQERDILVRALQESGFNRTAPPTVWA